MVWQTEFEMLPTCKAEELHLKSRFKYYEFGERAHRLLSHQLRQAEAGAYCRGQHNNKAMGD